MTLFVSFQQNCCGFDFWCDMLILMNFVPDSCGYVKHFS